MKTLKNAAQWTGEQLRAFLRGGVPLLGILGFSLCSVHALAHLLMGRAAHPTSLYWLAAGLVESVTAWLVWATVGQFREVTQSNIKNQDRRFYGVMFVLLLILGVPSVSASIVANALEFGDTLLGLLFPSLCVGCAVGAAVPDAVRSYKRARAEEKARERADKEAREAEKAEKEAARLAAVEARLGAEKAQEVADLARKVAGLGAAGAAFDLLNANGAMRIADLAQELGKSPSSVRGYVTRLVEAELAERDKAVGTVWLRGNGAGER